ncbi:MAG TPA: hypothetical protein VGS19_16245 [Streptosporangiaceae bacterium]|nr:hypothetical protein [Streptosporangiaceae bacterium]
MNDLASPVDATTVRHQVMTAAAMAAQALTDTEQPPEGRLETLIEAHGQILASRGPASPLTFSAFRDLLTKDLALLLPDGVPAEEMQGVHLITQDGQYDDDLYDLQQEQRLVLRALAKATRGGRPATREFLEAEMDQERVYTALKKRQDPAAYVVGRKALIETPAGLDSKLRKLPLPSSVADYYQPIVHAATFDRWWFACPICRWPMKITTRRARGTKTGSAQCFHRPHAALGAAYHFKVPDKGKPPSLVPASSAPPRPSGAASVLFTDVRGRIPEPEPVEGHKALTRGVWRWTTIPGLVEVALYKALEARGLKPVLWPDLDSYDLHVEAGTGAGMSPFRIDLKDYSNPLLLARKVQADEGDAGGAQWLVVPDYRAPDVPLLTTVCKEFGLNVATAGEIGALVCQRVGARWA